MHTKDKHLGYFLDYNTWKDAYNLLEIQLGQKNSNRHYESLSMCYYDKLDLKRSSYSSDIFFNNFIKTDIIFLVRNIFFVYWYAVPKIDLSLRDRAFYSYPARLLHYALGLYLLKMSQDFLNEPFVKKPNIKSYYGASIFYASGKLIAKPEDLYFKKFYQEFRAQIKKELKDDLSNKVVMKFDIENYYYQFPMDKLLQYLNTSIKPSIKSKFKFDNNTTNIIKFFYGLISKKDNKIPVTDNDVIGRLISHLYLIFADIRINDIITSYSSIDSCSIIRYVDDYYISITFNNALSDEDKSFHLHRLFEQIADILHKEFTLYLNNKTEVYWLHKDDDKEKLRTNLKKVSNRIPMSTSEIDDDIQLSEEELCNLKLDAALNEIERLKFSGDEFIYEDRFLIHEEILKNIYDTRVDQLLNKPENIVRLRECFTGFNFNIVRKSPDELLAYILKDTQIKSAFRDYLLKINNITSNDTGMILNYLSKVDLDDTDLMNILRPDHTLADIIQSIDNSTTVLTESGHFNVKIEDIKHIRDIYSAIEQSKMRETEENHRRFSVALNHLLNEIHVICMHFDTIKKDNYDVNNVMSFLEKIGCQSELIISIRNLFDRRNMNSVSHPGSDEYIVVPVSEEDYHEYKKSVSDCIDHVLIHANQNYPF